MGFVADARRRSKQALFAGQALALISLLAFSASTAPAQECLDYSAHLQWVGQAATPGLANSVLLAPPYAYTTSHGLGVQVLSLEDPRHPTYLAGVDTPGFSFKLARRGAYLFVADGYAGLQVVDVTNPLAPALVAGHPSSYAYDVVARGDFVYLADYSGGLKIFDVSVPTAPTLVGQVATPRGALGVSLSGDLAFVAASGAGLLVVDISAPASPRIIGQASTAGTANDTAVADGYALVSNDEIGIEVFSVADPSQPTLVGQIALGSGGKQILYDRGCAYVGSGYAGLNIIDLADPTHPVLEGRSTIPFAKDTALYGDLAFVTNGMTGERGLDIFDIHHRNSPHALMDLRLPGKAVDVTLANGLAYVSGYFDNTTGELLVVDARNPGTAAVVGDLRIPAAGAVRDAVVAGDVAVLAMAGGLMTVDVSDPAAPNVLASVATECAVSGLVRRGDLVYAANGSCGLAVFDVSNPLLPLLKSRLELAGSTAAVELAGNRAYVGCGDSLCVVDVTDPEHLQVVSTTSMPSPVMGLALTANRVYVACSSAGVQIRGLANPDQPVLLGTLPSFHFAVEVAVRDDVAYVADGTGGVQVFDVADPSAPFRLGIYSPLNSQSAWVGAVAMGADGVYVADQWSGLSIIPLQCRGSAVEAAQGIVQAGALAAWPNPFNPETRLSFVVNDDGPVRLTIHDVRGRLVRTLVAADLTSGDHDATWDGRDEHGLPVASGSYLARLDAGHVVEVRRLTLVR